MLNEVKHLAKFVQTSENINVYIFSASAAELNGIATICLLEKLLGGDKPKGAKARSSEELKFHSSQATLSYRVGLARDP